MEAASRRISQDVFGVSLSQVDLHSQIRLSLLMSARFLVCIELASHLVI